MITWEDSWFYIKAAIPVWEMFIFSKEIYLPLHFDPNWKIQPEQKKQLSAGRLCLALNFLSVWMEFDQTVKEKVNDDYSQIQDQLKKWPANWENKIKLEIPVRHRQLTRLLNELRKKSDFSSTQFPQIIELRLMLEFLNAFLPNAQQLSFALDDRILKTNSLKNGFYFQPEFSKYYNPDRYWFLYRVLK